MVFVTAIDCAQAPVADLAVATLLFLDTTPPVPIVNVSRHSCLNEAAVSCRVAEGNGPVEATTTGSGNSLIIWCQFPPGLRGT